jgi:hypothetical protein
MNLKEQLMQAAREYADRFGEILGAEPEFCVGDTPTDLWCFGDCYFFNLYEMVPVVDRIDKYINIYGSKEAVGDRIRQWVDWWLDDGATLKIEIVRARVTHRLRVNINLTAWLDGIEPKERAAFSGPDADYLRLTNDHDTLTRLIAEFRGNRSLDNVLSTVDTLLERETEAKKVRDHEEWKKLTKTITAKRTKKAKKHE